MTKIKEWSPRYGDMPYAGVANTKKCVFCIQDNVTTSLTMLAAINSSILVQFNLNDLNDPLNAAGTEEIPGLLEWGLFYNNFRVLHVRITTTFVNVFNQPVIVGVALRPMDADPLWSSWSNLKNIDSTNIPNQRVMLDPGLGPRDQCTIVVESPLSALLGDKNLYKADIGYAGVMPRLNVGAGGRTAGTSPTLKLQGFAYIMTRNGLAATANTEVQLMTKIEYYVEMFGRKLFIQ